VFVDDGALTGTMVVFPARGGRGVSLTAEGDGARLRELTSWPLTPVWS
jgi:fructan beta-fructosidase